MAPVSSKIIVDAKKPISLDLSKADIKKAINKDPAHCAFAVCAVRTLKADEVLVYRTRAYLRFGGQWVRYVVPPATAIELLIFDRGGKVEGGKYRLLPPSPTNRLGLFRGEKDKKKKKTGKNSRKPRMIHKTKNVRVEAAKGQAIYERLGV